MYLVTAGLGACLAHGEPQCGAGRERPAPFATGDHLLGLPITHHLYLHVLRVLQAEGLGPSWGCTVGRKESKSWEFLGQVGQGASGRDCWRGEAARTLLGHLVWGTRKDPAVPQSSGNEEGAH